MTKAATDAVSRGDVGRGDLGRDGSGLRPDLQVIADLIPPNTKVLDLGCGNGELLDYLVQHKRVRGRGIELSEAGVLACVRQGLSVRQGNLQEGLADYPSNSMDYVVLSQTLPFLDDPAMIVQEMLRVGRTAILSLPNWGHWRCRLELLLTGRIPQAGDLPQSWDAAPRWQAGASASCGLARPSVASGRAGERKRSPHAPRPPLRGLRCPAPTTGLPSRRPRQPAPDQAIRPGPRCAPSPARGCRRRRGRAVGPC